jgi:glycosyltransferase involved in cell wall biosynthesis
VSLEDAPRDRVRHFERVAPMSHGRPLRILTFNYEYPPLGGGGGVFHAAIAEQLARRHHVAVITSAFGDLPRHEVREGVEIHRVPIVGRGDPSAASLASMLAYPPAAWLAALRLMRRHRYDLVHSHFAVPTGPASLPPALLARIPHVLSIQGGDIYDPSKKLSPHRHGLLRRVVTAVLRHSSAVVAASRNMRDHAYRHYPYRGPVEIIPLGIQIPEPGPHAARADLGLPEGAFLAVTVGRLVRRKGLDQVFRALAREDCPPVHLAVLGSGPELGPLQSLAESLHLTGRIHFVGRVSDERKWQILRCADAYVSASMHEGFGLVYLEAMAAGLPVLAPEDGGQADFLAHGQTGYAVDPEDPGSLARALSQAVARPEELRRMSGRNRKRSSAFSIQSCMIEYEKLFYRVLNAVGGGVAALISESVH